MGSLAAAGAAGIGTGAFTSVQANRALTVETADDADALLGLEACDTPNGNEYVDESGNALSIDISTADGDGVNDDAYTVVRNLFKVTNNGTQKVYVWAEGLPAEIRMFHDDTATNDVSNSEYSINNGGNDGAFSTSSAIDPNDIKGEVESGGPGGDEAAPLLTSGEMLSNVGLLVDTRNGEVNFDQDITIKAVAVDEV